MSLRRNFFWVMLGNGYYGLSKWLVLVILAKLGSATKVGEYALALSIVEPIAILCQLQLRPVLAADVTARRPFGHYATLRAALSLLALGVVFAIAILGHFNPSLRIAIGLLGVAYAVDLLSDISYGLLQQRERMDWIARSQMAKGTGSLVAVAAGLYFGGELTLAIGGMACSWILVFLLYDLRQLRKTLAAIPGALPWRWLAPEWLVGAVQLARESWPLGAALWLNAYALSVPRYSLAGYTGSSDLGLFAGMMALIGIGGILVAALCQAAVPRLARHYAHGDWAAFYRLFAQLILFALLVGGVAWAVGSILGTRLLAAVYQAEFAPAAGLLPLVLFAGALEYLNVCFGNTLTLMRVFRPQLWVALVTLAASAAASVTLIRRWGLTGAAYQTVVVAGVRLLLHAVLLRVSVNRARRSPGTSAI